jgi:hypothetical protein
VIKFWLAISKEEQHRRFKEREQSAFKRFKIRPEDWRNRKKWEGYERAVCDMVDRTSTALAPWTLVEANDKLYARIKVLEPCDAIERALAKTTRIAADPTLSGLCRRPSVALLRRGGRFFSSSSARWTDASAAIASVCRAGAPPCAAGADLPEGP